MSSLYKAADLSRLYFSLQDAYSQAEGLTRHQPKGLLAAILSGEGQKHHHHGVSGMIQPLLPHIFSFLSQGFSSIREVLIRVLGKPKLVLDRIDCNGS